jgi:TfoX/Sxy family transcriptional regulator of competence genes
LSYDPGLVARIADALGAVTAYGVRQKNMFGGLGFLIGKSTFAIAWGDDLIVKTRREVYESLLREPGTKPFSPDGESSMGTWIVVAAEAIADDPELVEWLRRGVAAVR